MASKGKEVAKDIAIGAGIGYAVTLVGNIHNHREMSHQTVELHSALREVARFATWLGFGSDSRTFATNHLVHHRYAGTKKDPHPVELLGTTRVFFGSPYMNAKATRRIPASLTDELVFSHRGGESDPAFIRDADGQIHMRPHPLDKLLTKSWLGIGVGTVLLAKHFGVKRGVRIMAVNLAYVSAVVGIDNAFAHTYGEAPEDNPGTNMGYIASLITGGEAGGHNYHHAHPEDPRNAVDGVPDSSYAIIKGLCRIGLARVSGK